jgi:glycosyltransferase involved in cell wall biosynthesis
MSNGDDALLVCMVHNYYREPGGEDVVFEAEADLLERHGHRVERLTVHNDEIPDDLGAIGRAGLAARTIWSRQNHNELRSLLHRLKPDIVHFHNTFPLISPSAYAACREAAVPVIQELHNYRLLCPSAEFFRDGHPCEDCLGKTPPWPGVLHACYRSSRSQTAVVAAMLTAHRFRGTWRRDVDVYIAGTEFVRQKFIEGGFPPDKIVVKPNFVPNDPSAGGHDGNFVLFVGRLTTNKGLQTLLKAMGVETLLKAWELLEGAVPLHIVGAGPLAETVRHAAESSPSIEYVGRLERSSVLALMRQAPTLIFPSEWYEPFGLVMVEAFACGLPVIGSRLASMAEIIDDGRTGLHFTPGDPADLAAKIQWAWTHPQEMQHMGMEARREYETKYTAERIYDQLMQIYERAMAARKERQS